LEDISFITNKAAVNFEKQDYDECIANCDDAVEKGRELRVDYKVGGGDCTAVAFS
jgi:stress-induced-phosphoprotein 1